MESKRAIAFFRGHAGGIVGQRMETALHLARAERIASENDWTYTWEFSQDFTDSLGDHEYWCADAKRAKREGKRPACEHEILDVLLRDASGTVLASLGGCIDVSRAYARVVEAELACEALAEMSDRAVPGILRADGGK